MFSATEAELALARGAALASARDVNVARGRRRTARPEPGVEDPRAVGGAGCGRADLRRLVVARSLRQPAPAGRAAPQFQRRRRGRGAVAAPRGTGRGPGPAGGSRSREDDRGTRAATRGRAETRAARRRTRRRAAAGLSAARARVRTARAGLRTTACRAGSPRRSISNRGFAIGSSNASRSSTASTSRSTPGSDRGLSGARW